MPDTTNTPCGRVCGVRDERRECEHAGHHKHAPQGVFVVFEMRGRGRNMPDTTNAPTRVCLWCSRRGEGAGTRRTPQTRPQGCVCGVRDKGKGQEHVWLEEGGSGWRRTSQTRKTRPTSAFFMFGVSNGDGGTAREGREGVSTLL